MRSSISRPRTCEGSSLETCCAGARDTASTMSAAAPTSPKMPRATFTASSLLTLRHARLPALPVLPLDLLHRLGDGDGDRAGLGFSPLVLERALPEPQRRLRRDLRLNRLARQGGRLDALGLERCEVAREV